MDFAQPFNVCLWLYARFPRFIYKIQVYTRTHIDRFANYKFLFALSRAEVNFLLNYLNKTRHFLVLETCFGRNICHLQCDLKKVTTKYK